MWPIQPRIEAKTPLFILTISLLLSSCSPTSHVDQTSRSHDDKASRLDTIFSELHSSRKFNGNVLVAESGRVIFKGSYGLADEEQDIALNTDTKFELASVSKQFTAIGIVQLHSKGLLSYHDSVKKYIPELEYLKGINIYNLLTHTAGIPDYMELADSLWDKSRIANNDDILAMFKKAKPKKLFEPNEQWSYSNTGYLILASIIERVSGQSFGEYLEQNVFKPLGMKNTFVYRKRYQPETVKNYAKGYIYSDSLASKIPPDEMGQTFYTQYLDGIVGDGMVSSNLEDLLKWDRALYGSEIIDDEDRELIFSTYQTLDSLSTDYGFGWFIKTSKPYGKVAYHSGSWGGYITYIERHLDSDKTIIILQNNLTANTEIPIKNTRKVLYDLPVERPITLGIDILEKYCGIYKDEDGEEDEIILDGNTLFVPINSEVKLELIPVSKTKFILDKFRPEVTFTFILNDKGEAEKYRVQQPEQGLDAYAIRVK